MVIVIVIVIDVFCVFVKKKYEKLKKVMKFLTGLYQDDVTTSRGDVTSRTKLYGHVRVKIWEKSEKEFWKSFMVKELGSKK